MDNPLVVSLVVSGIGMLILFLSLSFLYVLMYLMTTFIKDKPTLAPTDQPASQSIDQLRQAAIIAVALACAEQELAAPPLSPSMEERKGEAASPWRMLHHQRQLTLNLPTRRVR